MKNSTSSSSSQAASSEGPVFACSGEVMLRVRVHPRSSRAGLAGIHGTALKVNLTTPPVDGRANKALIEFFSKLLGVKKKDIEIASGKSSRDKVLRLCNTEPERTRAALEAALGR